MRRTRKLWSSFLVTAIYGTVALGAHIPTTASAQSVSVSPRVAAMQGNTFAASLGARLDIGSPRIGAYGHVGVFGVTQTCETSLPPGCSSPSGGGTELSGGIRLAFPNLGKAYPVISVGAGALVWRDDDPYESSVGLILEFEGGVQAAFLSWADFTVRVKAQSISQGVSGGMRLDRDRSTYVGIVAGLVLPLHR